MCVRGNEFDTPALMDLNYGDVLVCSFVLLEPDQTLSPHRTCFGQADGIPSVTQCGEVLIPSDLHSVSRTPARKVSRWMRGR